MKSGKKITILGAGNVGATIAYTLTVAGMASEIVLIDINHEKAKGEAMDIIHGTAFCPPVDIYAGDHSCARDSDIVIVTLGMARKPGMTRLDLAQNNADIVKNVLPRIAKYAPGAIYVVVSNPVDILTYAAIRSTGLPANQVFGSGTLLDSSRLRTGLAEHVSLNAKNVHAYVFGEHGDTSMIPWSLTSIGGMPMKTYCTNICENRGECRKVELRDIENDMRTAGAKVIAAKGATYYAIALAVREICDSVLRDTQSLLTVSGLVDGSYGISDVCLSLPFVVGGGGLERVITPPLAAEEQALLHKSADTLKNLIASIKI